MSIITIFSSGFCNEATIIEQIVARTGYQEITDDTPMGNVSSDVPMPVIGCFSTKRYLRIQVTASDYVGNDAWFGVVAIAASEF